MTNQPGRAQFASEVQHPNDCDDFGHDFGDLEDVTAPIHDRCAWCGLPFSRFLAETADRFATADRRQAWLTRAGLRSAV